MFNQIKNLFGFFKRQSDVPPAPEKAPNAAKTAPAPAKAPTRAPAKAAAAKPATPPPVAAPTPPPAAAASTPAPAASSTGPDETLTLPLRTILSRLPASLSALVKSGGTGEVALPLKKVLTQLPQGVVKVTFGELRQGAPAGAFLEVTSQDQTLVELPLPEILARINPALLTRRPAQKTIEVPAEVGNVFGPRGETLNQKPEPAAAKPAPAAPVAKAAAPVAPAPELPKPTAPPQPAKPIIPSAPLPAPASALPKSNPIAAPNLPPPPKKSEPAPSIPAPKIPAPALAKEPEPVSVPSAASAPSGEVLTVALASISDGWPEAVREEMRKNNLQDSSVALPMNQIEVQLRSGKISFPWKQIGSWIKPTPLGSSQNGDLVLDLPLKIIAPLFITQHRPAKPQKKMALGENIPDIFSGAAPVGKAAAPASAPVSAPAIPKPAAAPLPASPAISMPKPAMPSAPAPVAAKEPTTLAEVFGDVGKKDFSPGEIVQKASALKGLSGALIATNDGLLVSGQVPAPLKAETTAAFLPQIFGRMNQYGKELQVGDLNSLTLEFNKVPWYVAKIGQIYFGAVGKTGEALPASSLNVIIAELGKQNR